MIRAAVAFYAAAVVAGSAAPVPGPQPAAYPPVPSALNSSIQGRASQIMRMQWNAPALPSASPGMTGAEASLIQKRFMEGDTRPQPAADPAPTGTDPQ